MYSKVTPKFKSELFKLINDSSKILITGHMSPDDDAISATTSVKYALDKLFPQKEIEVVFSGEKIERFSYFESIVSFSFVSDISDIFNNYDLIICLDGGQYYRFTKNPEILQASKAQKISIDHHQTPQDKFDLALQIPQASSTSELVYTLFKEKEILDKNFAELILLGILGDTGTFNYIKPNQSGILLVVKKLLDISKIEIQDFKAKYSLYEKNDFEINKELLKNSKFCHVDGWPDFQVAYLTREYIKSNGYGDKDLDSASNIFVSIYLRLVRGYPWGFTIRPLEDGSCKLSFCSLPGSVSVRLLAEKMQIGGGHDRAAGASFKNMGVEISPVDIIDKIKDYLKNNKPDLV